MVDVAIHCRDIVIHPNIHSKMHDLVVFIIHETIPSALQLFIPVLDFSYNAVTTSSTAIEGNCFLPKPDFTSNESVSSNI